MDFDDTEIDELAARLDATGSVLGPRRRRRAARRLAAVRSPAAAEALATAYASSEDDQVVAIAEAALARLDDQASIDAVCDSMIAHGDERLTGLVRTAGYLHSDPTRRALQLFLAGDFERYSELDFDGSMLTAARSVADESLRTRLAERARESARVDWVHAVVGTGRIGDLRVLADDEWESVLGILASAARWDDMWRLVAEAPPLWGVRLLKKLGERRWRPSSDAARADFGELIKLAQACSGELTSNFVTAEPTVLAGRMRQVLCSVVTPDGTLLAIGSYDDGVRLWRLPSGEQVRVLTGHMHSVSCLAVTPDGSLLASGDSDGRVRLWHLPSGRPAGVLTGHAGGVWCLAVTPDGSLLASGDSDGRVWLWRLPSGETVARVLTGPRSRVKCLAVTPDGSLLASGGSDGRVRLWSLPSGELVDVLNGYVQASCLAVTPDGSLLASGGSDGRVRLWRLPSGEPAGVVTDDASYGGYAVCIALTPDGSLLASGGDEVVRLWSLPSGEPVGVLEDHTSRVRCLAMSPDGSLLVSGDNSGEVRLWHARLRTASRTRLQISTCPRSRPWLMPRMTTVNARGRG